MKLWINADDFGWTESCTKAIIESFNKKWLTTTTATVNGKYFNEAIAAIRGTRIEKCLGIHFNLTEGYPLTKGISTHSRFCENGKFIMFPSRNKPLSKKEINDVYIELSAQAECFKSTMIPCNHVDSHHHVHNSIPIFPIFMKVMKEQGWNKLRIFRNIGNIFFIKRIIKAIYNYRIQKSGYAYSSFMGSIQDYVNYSNTNKKEIFEIMVHPDYQKDNKLLINRDDSSDYDSPLGEPFSRLFEFIKTKKDIILEF